MPSFVAWWKPVVADFPTDCATRIWELGQHMLALSKMSCQIGSTGEQRPLTMFIAELTLEPFGPVFLIFMPFQIGGTCTLVVACIAREYLLLHMYVGNVLVPYCSGSKSFGAFWALVRAVPTVSPCMPLYTVCITMISYPAAKPAAVDFALDIVGYLEVLVQLIPKATYLSARLSSLISPLAAVNGVRVSITGLRRLNSRLQSNSISLCC